MNFTMNVEKTCLRFFKDFFNTKYNTQFNTGYSRYNVPILVESLEQHPLLDNYLLFKNLWLTTHCKLGNYKMNNHRYD